MMRSSTAAALASGTCVFGFLAGWLVFHSDGTCKVEPPAQPIQRAESPEPTKASATALELEKPDSRLVIQPSPAVLPDPAPVARLPESAKAAPSADPSDPRNLPESNLEEMAKKRNAIQAALDDRTRPVTRQRFQDGQFDHVSDDPQWKPGASDWDIASFSAFRAGASGCDRTTIPRDQFPDLYVYYDESLRLDNLVRAAEKDLARRASATPR